MYQISIFVTPNCSTEAVEKVRGLLKEMPSCDYVLEVVDVESQPTVTGQYDIKSTPAVVVSHPEKGLRVFYSIPDSYEFRYALGLQKLW